MSLVTQQNIDQFHEEGYFLTDVVIEKSTLDAMCVEMERVFQEEVAAAKKTGNDAAVKAALGARAVAPFHVRSDVAAELVKHPIYLDMCRAFIGPDADLYYNQITTKYPERGKIFGWHQDSGYTTTNATPYITCWTAITDATIDNGTIWVIPGSHKWGILPHEQTEETPDKFGGVDAVFEDESGAIPVEAKAGSNRLFQLPYAAPLWPEHIRHPAPRVRPPIPYPRRNTRQNGSTIRRSVAGAARQPARRRPREFRLAQRLDIMQHSATPRECRAIFGV